MKTLKWFAIVMIAELCFFNGNLSAQERQSGDVWVEEIRGEENPIWWQAEGWNSEEKARKQAGIPDKKMYDKAKKENLKILEYKTVGVECKNVSSSNGKKTYYWCWEIWQVKFEKKGGLKNSEMTKLQLMQKYFSETARRLENTLAQFLKDKPRLAGMLEGAGFLDISERIRQALDNVKTAKGIIEEIQRTHRTDLLEKLSQIESQVKASVNDIDSTYTGMKNDYNRVAKEKQVQPEKEKQLRAEKEQSLKEQRVSGSDKSDKGEIKGSAVEKENIIQKNRLDFSVFDDKKQPESVKDEAVKSTGKKISDPELNFGSDKSVTNTPEKTSKLNWSLFEESSDKAVTKHDMKSESPKPFKTEEGTLGSVMLLIDTSGSMEGNKIASAKNAAINSAKRALDKKIEVAVFTFSGDCSNPIRSEMGFSNNFEKISAFINSLTAGGGTPLAPAIEQASSFLADNRSPSSQHQMTLLLADGNNDCGNIADTLDLLKQRGQIFRHETIGLEIEPYSQASKELQDIASKTGGQYRAANDVQQLASVFNDAIDTITMLEMLGGFGEKRSEPKKKSQGNKSNKILDNF